MVERQNRKRRADVDLGALYSAKRQQTEERCPYLSTINRHLLDFDFAKVCSVTNTTLNVYSCLVCGKYFQGKGQKTPAYMHSLEKEHFVFLSLDTNEVWCLPDNYPVDDPSLFDVRFNMKPSCSKDLVLRLNSEPLFSRSLEGKEFLPGCVGLNHI
jgi:U4/U6.U5 tri-snRNP-associated protein 2